jgi:hypothetical protein
VKNVLPDLVSDGLKAHEENDYKTAFELFSKACDSGDVKGCFHLALLYYYGRGVKQDYFKAVELFSKACDGGEAKACFWLGIMYEKGKDVQQDITKALELYAKAYEMGDERGLIAYEELKCY